MVAAAAQQNMDMGIVGVPVIDCDPVEPGAKVGLHVDEQFAGECPHIRHFDGVFGRDDEAEMMSVVRAATSKGIAIRHAVGAAVDLRVLAVARDAIALQIGDVAR